MHKYNPMTFDFHKLRLTFMRNGKKITIKGTTDTTKLQHISTKGLKKLVRKNSLGFIGQPFVVTAKEVGTTTVETSTSAAKMAITPLLTEFNDVFQDPKKLPSHRTRDHHIKLKDESATINARPYRYPYGQKNKLRRWYRKCWIMV